VRAAALAVVVVVVAEAALACVRSAVPDAASYNSSHEGGGVTGPRYRDPALPAAERARDLVGHMTLAEKVGQMVNEAPAIPALGVPAYDWWSEGLHGVGRAGIATVFPQAIGLAAMWDEPFLGQVATAISDEARAKHHEAARRGKRGRYQGLTYFSPNVNLFRDPRWGRGQETYGEDPYLTSRLAVAFIQGLQGGGPDQPGASAAASASASANRPPPYLKLVATAKHFAVHSGPEALRHGFDVHPSPHDLRDSYLPQFEASVRAGGVGAVMPAYNRVDGQPCAASPRLLQTILREEWGFTGFVVSDCGAIDDIYRAHGFARSAEQAAALAVRAGTDLSCGGTYGALVKAVKQGLIGEAEIDRAVVRLFTARFALGMFDPPERVPWARIPIEVVDSPAHRELAKRAAQKSLVLLKNDGGALPLSTAIKAIAVVGPTADDEDVLLGNYNGKPSRAVTILDGLRDKARARGVDLRYAKGCGIASPSARSIDAAVAAVSRPEVGAAVVVLGLSPRYEGEENDSAANPSGDRRDLALPGVQQRLLEAVAATGKPTVLVLTGGSALGIAWAKASPRVPAILVAWYPGEEGGTAVADVLFGDYNPAGRLPVTFYRGVQDLPPFDDYAMAGRTYRYFQGEPTYAFGEGRSFTTFRYSDLRIAPRAAGVGFEASVDVTNTGARAGDEVVQAYVAAEAASALKPIRALAGFRRIALARGERQRVTFPIDARALSLVDAAGVRRVDAGWFAMALGGRQPDRGGNYRSDADGLTTRAELTAAAAEIARRELPK
jgi:beta-glucosidase